MNEKNDILDYPPLQRIVNALYDETLPAAQLKESLRERGYDPDTLVASVRQEVATTLRAERLAWQAEARQNLARLRSLRDNATGWAARTRSEIEDAFNRAVAGALGEDARLRVQVAFRNLDQVSLEDKASFLNDMEALNRLEDNGGDHNKNP